MPGMEPNFELNLPAIEAAINANTAALILNSPNNPSGNSFPMEVADGCIFVMGDNRDDSKDSRHPDIGLVDKREILGKALVLMFPGTDKGYADRDYSRIGVLY